MSAHTAGPWHRNISPATRYPTIFAGRNTHVAVVKVDGLPPEQVEANCALIAEAPTMLDALKDARESLMRLPDVDGAYRITCIGQIDAILARLDGGEK